MITVLAGFMASVILAEIILKIYAVMVGRDAPVGLMALIAFLSVGVIDAAIRTL